MIEIRELLGGEVERLVALFDAVLPGFAASLATDFDGPSSFLQDPTSVVLGGYRRGADRASAPRSSPKR